MNQLLSEISIRLVCRELLATGRPVSGRQLRRVLKERYHAVGKTERIFRIWREEGATFEGVVPRNVGDATDLSTGTEDAERARTDWQRRAEQAEAREDAHQERWAAEVDRLRQSLLAQPGYAAEIRSLQERVLRLTAELHAARCLLANSGSQS